MDIALLGSFYAIMAVSLTYAWLRGGGTERKAVALLIAFFLFRIGLRPVIPANFNSVDPLALAQDLIGFAGFVWIGMSARRYWPLAAAALQLMSLGGHFARAMEVSVSGPTYSAMKSGPTLLLFILLSIGTLNFQRRKARAKSRGFSPALTSVAVLPSWSRRSPCSDGRAKRH